MSWVEWSPAAADTGTMVRSLLAAVFGLHSSSQNEIWLWRGEADSSYKLEPGMHTRVRASGSDQPASRSDQATRELISLARGTALDRLDGVVLPDLALLAHLQHHGAATPLLDVSVDPLVALWMVANASGDNINDSDDQPGRLVAIRRPPSSRWLAPFDARDFASGRKDIASQLAEGGLHWYRPPDVSERLRIQRGSFVLGRYDAANPLTSLPVQTGPSPGKEKWLGARIDQIGQRGRRVAPSTEAALFLIPRRMKASLREWLDDRAGLSRSVIYPTPWNRPHLEAFCASYARRRALNATDGGEGPDE